MTTSRALATAGALALLVLTTGCANTPAPAAPPPKESAVSGSCDEIADTAAYSKCMHARQAPVSTDPEDKYLSIIALNGINANERGKLIAVGRAVCSEFASTESEDAAADVADRSGFPSRDEQQTVLSAATQTFCPEYAGLVGGF